MKLAIVATAFAALLAAPVHAQIEVKKPQAKKQEQKKLDLGKNLRKKDEAQKKQQGQKKLDLGKDLRKKQEAQKK